MENSAAVSVDPSLFHFFKVKETLLPAAAVGDPDDNPIICDRDMYIKEKEEETDEDEVVILAEITKEVVEERRRDIRPDLGSSGRSSKPKKDHLVSIVHCTEKGFVCQLCCQFTTDKLSHLRRHVQVKHGSSSNNNDDHSYSAQQPQQQNGCDFKTGHFNHFVAHSKVRHPKKKDSVTVVYDHQGQQLVQVLPRRHRKTSKRTVVPPPPPEKRFACDKCNFRTAHLSCLSQHRKTSHLTVHDKEFVCYFCSYAGISVSLLNQHVKTIHMMEKKYRCSKCEYAGSCTTNLKKHINVHHREDK